MQTGPKQHYVQQMLLNPFAVRRPGRRNAKLFGFNKVTLRSFPLNVKDAAQSRYHYRTHERFGLTEPNALDHILTKLEGKFAPTYNKVLRQLSAGMVELDEDERSAFIELMVFAHLRTPQMRERLGMLFAHGLLEDAPEGVPLAMERETEKIVHQATMLRSEVIEDVRQTWHLGWLVFAEAEGGDFVTSDAPVHVISSVRDPGTPGTVFMPVSPRHAAYIIPALPEGSMPDLHIKPMRSELVEERNLQTVAHARTWVFARSSDFTFARDLAHEEPDYFRLGMPLDDSGAIRFRMRSPGEEE